MKPGSLVVCIDNKPYLSDFLRITPSLEPTIYTVQEIFSCACGCGNTAIVLEELRNRTLGNIVLGYDINCFREVEPLPEISLEEILEMEEVC